MAELSIVATPSPWSCGVQVYDELVFPQPYQQPQSEVALYRQLLQEALRGLNNKDTYDEDYAWLTDPVTDDYPTSLARVCEVVGVSPYKIAELVRSGFRIPKHKILSRCNTRVSRGSR